MKVIKNKCLRIGKEGIKLFLSQKTKEYVNT